MSQGRRHTTTIGWAQVGGGTETFIAHAHTLHKGEILGESCSAIYLSRGARWGSAYEFSPRGCVDAWQTGGGGVYTGGRTVEASSSANQINIIISHYTLAIFLYFIAKQRIIISIPPLFISFYNLIMIYFCKPILFKALIWQLERGWKQPLYRPKPSFLRLSGSPILH